MPESQLPTLRWGIIATGIIASCFVDDLILKRKEAKATHVVQAIGSSSIEKGRTFAEKHLPGLSPTVYGSYEEVYNDPNVDCVYIATPHAFHKKNALDAIKAGKHVLCEKPFTINARETEEVISAAKKKGVYVMEAMWTRFLPLAHRLHELLHIEKRIGKVHRVFVDFGLEKDISTLPLGSRHKDLALGAGSLLDVGVYSLTWGLIILEGGHDEQPEITSKICMQNGIEVATSIILNYPKSMRQGILTSTTLFKTSRDFARIEGSKGSVVLSGNYSSEPESFTVKMTDGEEWVETFEKPGWGFHYEADEVALDIVQGKKENAIMPLSETLRVMKLMDAVRKEGGARYPQDDEYMLGVYPPLDD